MRQQLLLYSQAILLVPINIYGGSNQYVSLPDPETGQYPINCNLLDYGAYNSKIIQDSQPDNNRIQFKQFEKWSRVEVEMN